MTTAHDFTLQDLPTGNDVALSSLSGKAILLVNVASACGLTPQYAVLEAVHRHYVDADLVVIGVPCNQFGAQEPGTAQDIEQFCATTYDVTFPMARKVDVNGDTAHPLFKWLTDDGKHPVAWNFNKFLINKDGTVAARFEPKVEPDDLELLKAIDVALGLDGISVRDETPGP